MWHVFQDKGSSQGVSQRSSGPSFRADPKVIKRLHRLEKHMRENKLRHTFADQLGEAQESDELNSKKEARKLAFYLFWNVRPNFDRYNFLSCVMPIACHGNEWIAQVFADMTKLAVCFSCDKPHVCFVGM